MDEADAGDEAADTLVDDDIIDNELIRESQEASKRVQDRETLRDNVRRSVRAVVDAELPTDREALFDDEPRGPLVSVPAARGGAMLGGLHYACLFTPL